MSPIPTDPFGDRLDADTIEQAALASLQAWMPDHLAHQERRKAGRLAALGYSGQHLPAVRSWPTVDEMGDLEAHERLPAIVLVSPGTIGAPEALRRDPVLRQTWRLELAVVLAGKSEREGRLLASIYLAAAKGALLMDRTLGGKVETVYIVGADDHAFGETEKGARRAIYGCPFAVVARDEAGPTPVTAPSPDPYNPVPIPPTQLEADIVITATPTDQEVETP